MADNIKTKNIKLNLNLHDEKRIFDYFKTNKDNFSKVTKALLLKYIDGDRNDENNVNSKSVMEILENNTKLLEKLVENGVKIDSSFSENLSESETDFKVSNDEDKSKDDGNFNIDFLNQL